MDAQQESHETNVKGGGSDITEAPTAEETAAEPKQDEAPVPPEPTAPAEEPTSTTVPDPSPRTPAAATSVAPPAAGAAFASERPGRTRRSWVLLTIALALGVLFWVAGFDTVYACLDADFDRAAGLHSLPARFGRKGAFRLAVLFHLAAFACFVITGLMADLNYVFGLGLAVTAVALFYQHVLTRPTDLSRIQLSFFTMNGLISVVLFVATWLALVV